MDDVIQKIKNDVIQKIKCANYLDSAIILAEHDQIVMHDTIELVEKWFKDNNYDIRTSDGYSFNIDYVFDTIRENI